jgi:magnesium transporter
VNNLFHIVNCSIEPKIPQMDFFGICIAIIGAVTVIFAANTSDTRLDQDGIIRAISQKPFITYTTIYVVAAVILVFLSPRQIGKRFVFVDVGLCALFGTDFHIRFWRGVYHYFEGGFTVLSTKGVSTLITVNGYKVFTLWIIYPIFLVSTVN